MYSRNHADPPAQTHILDPTTPAAQEMPIPFFQPDNAPGKTRTLHCKNLNHIPSPHSRGCSHIQNSHFWQSQGFSNLNTML